MSLLAPGDQVTASISGQGYRIEAFLGAGGQGEVYRATSPSGTSVAVKWYFSQHSEDLRNSLTVLVHRGAPNPKFLWPTDIVEKESGFGYVMGLRPPEFAHVGSLLARKITTSFRELIIAAIQVVGAFKALHAQGLYYCDISDRNLFFNPGTGDVLICDNDNVGSPELRRPDVRGTPRFMAPEIVIGHDLPGPNTDMYSLAVLLFLLLMNHHPLDGKKESEIHCFDPAAMEYLYGKEPVFIFDPVDDSNRPVPGMQDNAIAFWNIYPREILDVFTKAFTVGLRHPDQRVRYAEWLRVLVGLRDSLIYCSSCRRLNFYEKSRIADDRKTCGHCWGVRCGKPVQLPPRVRIGKCVVMLNYDTRLSAYHLGKGDPEDTGSTVGEVVQSPDNPSIWGLRNVSADAWNVRTASGDGAVAEPGQTVTIDRGVVVNFGGIEGEFALG